MGKGNKEGTSKQFRWTKPMEHLFHEILAEEAQKGNKPSNSFKAVSINRVAEAISERFQAQYDVKHLENHLRTAHKKYESFLNKSMDHYDEMALVVGKDIATGSFSRTFADIDLDDDNQDSVPIDYENEEIEELGKIGNALEQFTAEKTPDLYEEVMSMEVEGFDDDFLCSIFDYLVSHESDAKTFLVKKTYPLEVWFRDDSALYTYVEVLVDSRYKVMDRSIMRDLVDGRY
ncbi:hypothetical protein PVK06_040970 [Gossypium arboreum]|uniref:Myb/SANT-like domain-containing protein n=1 Tax=Gossypium arboreum TaxID=29729 RepID=A0ABR0N717_GOSAR|nr:hypothetical protein PVK06_040970 [Gossypium arboreum]